MFITNLECFIDKQFNIRGYQKVDFELKAELVASDSQDDESDLFDNLIMEGNYLEWKPPEGRSGEIKEPEMTLKEIYDEFWDLIEEDNDEFKEFIIKDKRRENLKP